MLHWFYVVHFVMRSGVYTMFKFAKSDIYTGFMFAIWTMHDCLSSVYFLAPNAAVIILPNNTVTYSYVIILLVPELLSYSERLAVPAACLQGSTKGLRGVYEVCFSVAIWVQLDWCNQGGRRPRVSVAWRSAGWSKAPLRYRRQLLSSKRIYFQNIFI